MNLEGYLRGNYHEQTGGITHDSFVRYLATEEVLKRLGINPPYKAISFEVGVSRGGRRRCDLVILNHELSIIEAKVVLSEPTTKKVTRKIKGINQQLRFDHSFFRGKTQGNITLIGAYKIKGENFFNYYLLPSSGINISGLDILQIPCK